MNCQLWVRQQEATDAFKEMARLSAREDGRGAPCPLPEPILVQYLLQQVRTMPPLRWRAGQTSRTPRACRALRDLRPNLRTPPDAAMHASAHGPGTVCCRRIL